VGHYVQSESDRVSLEGYPKHNVVKFLGDLEVVSNKRQKIATRCGDTLRLCVWSYIYIFFAVLKQSLQVPIKITV
jgi:hypothetical protein